MNKHPELPGYAISTDHSQMDLQMIWNWLSGESYWAGGISFDTVARAVENSICFGLFFRDKQVGFARVVSDQASFAYLADVFILEVHRGKGLARWMMQTIQAHPSLQGLRRWMLVTRDAHGLYERCGWSRLTPQNAEGIMQIHDPHVYHQ